LLPAARGLADRKLLRTAHNSFLMKELIQLINRTHFGRYGNKRYLAQVVARLEALVQEHNCQAIYRLAMLHWDGHGVPQDRECAIPLLQAAAEGGIINAVFNLALAYDNGLVVAQSHCKALQYYTKAAQLGNIDAIHAAGSMLYAGEGTPPQPAKAKHWFLKAAKLGHAVAMYDVASCYQLGTGTPQNTRLAIQWYERALAAGETRALTGLGHCYCKLVSPPNLVRGRSYFEQASALGYGNATYNLGLLAEKGLGQPALLPDALFWYKRAADFGHEGAALKVAGILGELF